MLSEKTFTTVSNLIADNKYRKYCTSLDAKLMNALKASLENRHISVKRQNEIVNAFCNTLLGGK
jgi:hypothetical protein